MGFFLNIVERLSRVGPPRLGDVSQAQRTPATLGLSMQQLGAEVIDEFIDRSSDILGNYMGRTLRLDYLDDPEVFERTIGESGRLVRAVVERSVQAERPVGELLKIRLFVTSASRNKELEKQNRFAMTQLAFTWYEKATQTAIALSQPDIPPLAREVLMAVLKGSRELVAGLAELLEQPDIEVVVPDLMSLMQDQVGLGGQQQVSPEQMLQAITQQAGAGGAGAGEAGAVPDAAAIAGGVL